MNNRIARFLYFFVTSLLVIAPAFYNGYPLVYFDSGAYMEMSVSLEPSFHRSIGYPLLMKLIGWNITNWTVIGFQGMLVSLLLFRLVSILFPADRWRFHFLTVLILGFFSSMSWYAAQLMPDIFTLITGLCLLLLTIEKNLNWKQVAVYSVVLFASLITHLSHLPLVFLMLVSLAVVQFFRSSFVKLSKATWGILAGTLMVAGIFLASYNAIHDRGFGLSKASNVFLTASIGEMGFLKLYLDENCGQPGSTSLCGWKDQLPLETGGYLWTGDGPVQTHPGGWEGANEDYAPIVHDFLTKPRYLKWFLFGSVKATFKQMHQIELGSGLQYRYGEGMPPYWPMKTHFKQELNEYLISVQNKKDELPIPFFQWIHYLALFLSLGIIGWAVISRSLPDRFLLLLVTTVAFYVYHAAVTAVLANVYSRLQCRILPLIILMAVLFAFQMIVDNRSPSRTLSA